MDEHMIPLEEARRIVLAHVAPTEVVEVDAWRAVGLPLAEDVVTDIDLSPFANSAMDGYAVHARDLVGAAEGAPVTLSVVGHEAAGHVFAGEVAAGEAVRIMTGAPVPPGLDAVVKYEDVTVVEGDGAEGSRVAFAAPAPVGTNIREAGLEARAGAAVLSAGEVLTAAGAGLAASAGCARVRVRRAPVVGVLSIGTELVDAATVPARGQIRDANSAAILAAALDAGAEPRFFGTVPDDEAEIARAIHAMVEACDFVVTSGGASAGDYDYVEAIARREGTVLFDRISLRPGKAITFGLIGGTPFLGLSGNPAAACVGFEMLARPAIRAMRGHGALARPVQDAVVTSRVKKGQQRRFYDRAVVARDAATGALTVDHSFSQNSALLGTLQHANCLLMVPEGLKGYEPGDTAAVVRIDLPEGAVL